MGASLPFEIDPVRLGKNIRAWRHMRGFSQAELAERAGVGITTLYKAESGKPVRLKQLNQIVEKGLGGLLEECATTPRLSNVKPRGQAYIRHHHSSATWFAYGDRRRHIPEDNHSFIQDVQERVRLGRLGLATLFGSGLEYIMPDGPGMLFYEVHGPTDPISQNYRDAIYYILRGSVVMTIGAEEITLEQGDSIGCDGTLTVTLDLAEPIPPGGLPPLVQYIGANRVGRVNQRL